MPQEVSLPDTSSVITKIIPAPKRGHIETTGTSQQSKQN